MIGVIGADGAADVEAPGVFKGQATPSRTKKSSSKQKISIMAPKTDKKNFSFRIIHRILINRPRVSIRGSKSLDELSAICIYLVPRCGSLNIYHQILDDFLNCHQNPTIKQVPHVSSPNEPLSNTPNHPRIQSTVLDDYKPKKMLPIGRIEQCFLEVLFFLFNCCLQRWNLASNIRYLMLFSIPIKFGQLTLLAQSRKIRLLFFQLSLKLVDTLLALVPPASQHS